MLTTCRLPSGAMRVVDEERPAEPAREPGLLDDLALRRPARASPPAPRRRREQVVDARRRAGAARARRARRAAMHGGDAHARASHARAAKAPLPSARLVELVDLDELGAHDGLDDELGDLVAAGDRDGRRGVQVDGDDLDLAAVVAVDEARECSRATGRAAARARCAAGRSRRSPRGSRRRCRSGTSARCPGLDLDVRGGVQVEARVALVGVARERQRRVEALDRAARMSRGPSHDRRQVRRAASPRPTAGRRAAYGRIVAPRAGRACRDGRNCCSA